MTTTMEPISLSESKRRVELEQKVRAGESAFIEVGTSLIELRDSRLYRNDYATFEEYCQQVFGWSARRGRQLMAAAALVDEMKESGTTCSALPKNESEARTIIKERNQARKPICDAPSKNPAPVLDAETPIEKAERVIAAAVEESEEKLPPHIAALVYELALCRDNCDGLISCAQSRDCDSDTIKDAVKHLKKLGVMLLAFSMELESER